MTRAREAWLKSNNPEEWSEAMCVCQNGAPWECSENGECSRGGDCFTTERQGAAVAWQMINRLRTDNEVVRRQIDRAVAFIRYGKTD